MGRMFIAAIDEPTATTQRDLLEVTAGSGTSIIIHRVVLTTDIETDANEVQIEVDMYRYVGAFTAGSTSTTTATGYALGVTGATEDSATVTHGSTTQITGGTAELLGIFWVNNRIGLDYLPTPEERITVAATDAFALKLTATLGATTAFAGYVVYEEIVG